MDWQVTATTVLCSSVADEVTILVYPDWSVKCTGQAKYTSRKAGLDLVKRSLEMKQSLDCKGLGCATIAAYTDKLKSEEEKKAQRSGGKA